MLINRALFERFDTDADGILSVAELAKLVWSSHSCATEWADHEGIRLSLS